MLGLSLKHDFGVPAFFPGPWRLRSRQLPIGFHEFSLDFDSTVGFPGEGPLSVLSVLCSFLWACACLVECAPSVSHGLFPRNAEDVKRAERRQLVVLDLGRPVQPATRSNREKLLTALEDWCEMRGVALHAALQAAPRFPEDIVKILTEYGKDLFASGRPYSHYSETINAVGSKVPSVRRLLSGAWDYAFAWLREEPYEHHVACPPVVLLALVSTALTWGWPLVAGLLALSWSAITRIGEVIGAVRGDLILPCDVGYASASILLRIQEPKTRFRAARHQVAKTDYADMVSLITEVFKRLRPHQRLWPYSGQTLRSRFRQLLRALKLPDQSTDGDRALDLGSLRAGGATHLLNLTEDSELVRRRGRWLASRTMEIYLQESASITYFPALDDEPKRLVLRAAQAFPQVVSRITSFLNWQIPCETWWYLMSDENRREEWVELPSCHNMQQQADGQNADQRRAKELQALEKLSTVSIGTASFGVKRPLPAQPGWNCLAVTICSSRQMDKTQTSGEQKSCRRLRN